MTDRTERKSTEKFRAVIDENTSLSMYRKGSRSFCIIRKDLARAYEMEVNPSEAPIINQMLSDPEPYESSLADLKILDEEVFPISEAIKKIFGDEKDLKLNSIKLAIGGSINDYVTIRENDLIKFDVKPTLSGLIEFIKENSKSILGFLNCEYISEEGNVIYLNCGKKKISDNIFSIKLKILASMQQRGFFLQQEHKYYGLQLYIVIESRKHNDDKFFEFLKELGIDWELIFFRRRLAIHDWVLIECEKNSENLKCYLRAKFETLNYFDVNNIIRVVIKNQLPFIAANKMASLLYKMKLERALLLQEKNFEEVGFSHSNLKENWLSDKEGRIRRNTFQNQKNQPMGEYSMTLKKAEIAAAAKLACAYLGIRKKMKFDQDIPISEILKYEQELTHF
ncbi:MAG: hypothetical protein ACTSRI_21385 [Promethearchaeota archaeon]